MNCQETRQKLSHLADNELREGEEQAVRGHLAECPSCRRVLDEQGALDMLLKSRFSTELHDSDLTSLWPSVAERLDSPEEKPPNGGGAKVPDQGEIVFKSSSAMQMLNIPERRVESPYRAQSAGEPVAQPRPIGAWRWPVAFVLGAALIAGGLIYLKQTQAPAGGADQAARVAGEPGTIGPSSPGAAAGAAASQPASQPTSMAMADPNEAAPAPEPGAAVREEKVRPGTKAKRAKGKGKEGEEPRAKAEKSPATKAEAKAKPEAAGKGGKKKDDLDSLIDNVIGDDTPAKKKAAAAPKAEPGSDLPDQLDMNQIRNAMNKVKGHVQSCYDQFQVEGMAKVTFTISPDGSIKEASIKGKFFGTDTGTCVVGAVKKARFPKFKGKAMTIPNYPFLLQ